MTEERPDRINKLSNLLLFQDFLEKAGVADDAYAAVKLINGLLFAMYPEEDWFISRARIRDFWKEKAK